MKQVIDKTSGRGYIVPAKSQNGKALRFAAACVADEPWRRALARIHVEADEDGRFAVASDGRIIVLAPLSEDIDVGDYAVAAITKSAVAIIADDSGDKYPDWRRVMAPGYPSAMPEGYQKGPPFRSGVFNGPVEAGVAWLLRLPKPTLVNHEFLGRLKGSDWLTYYKDPHSGIGFVETHDGLNPAPRARRAVIMPMNLDD